jgi:hypothetical protein
MLKFDDLTVGAELRRIEVALDDEKKRLWSAIYGPAEGERMPAGMLVGMMMNVYMQATSPRPPGNIHAGQKLLFGALPHWGDTLTGIVTCQEKALRKDRRWVTFAIVLRRQSALALQGEVRTIWAM